jgi:hypothetical protein
MLQLVTKFIFNYLGKNRYNISCRSSRTLFENLGFWLLLHTKCVFTNLRFCCYICYKKNENRVLSQYGTVLQFVTSPLKSALNVTNVLQVVTNCNKQCYKTLLQVWWRVSADFGHFVTTFFQVGKKFSQKKFYEKEKLLRPLPAFLPGGKRIIC